MLPKSLKQRAKKRKTNVTLKLEELETWSSIPKNPFSNIIEHYEEISMLVLASGFDSLTSALKDGLGWKQLCEVGKLVRNKVSLKQKQTHI